MKEIILNDIKSLSHIQWKCKYHIVFAPKYKRLEIGQILRQLCEWKGITIIKAEVCPYHIHMLVEISSKYAVASVMGFLKGKIRSKCANMRYQYRSREFWCRGYYVDTVGKNTKKIKRIYNKSIERRSTKSSNDIRRFRPIYG